MDRGQSVSGASVAAAAARSLLRGQCWQALAAEVAWSAVRATGSDRAAMAWLTPLVEARLASGFDELEPRVRRLAAEAHAEHLAGRPHDRDGAEVVAAFSGRDEGIRMLSGVYFATLEWAVELLEARRPRRKRRGWRRSGGATDEPGPVICEVPTIVADEINGVVTRYGWRRRSAA